MLTAQGVRMTRLPRPPADAHEIDGFPLDATTKGVPHEARLRLGDIASRRWNVLAGDLPFPVAVLRADRLAANSRWMAAFAAANGLTLAPHGKTTMAPQLFALQMRDGAFAITVASVQQVAVVRRFGFPRAVLANQPVGRPAVDACFAALSAEDGFELFCLADSLEGVAALVPLLGQVEETVGLIEHALRSGLHGVVVRLAEGILGVGRDRLLQFGREAASSAM
jgi:D-serine dehydratase